jgi:hypothetical protein
MPSNEIVERVPHSINRWKVWFEGIATGWRGMESSIGTFHLALSMRRASLARE